jgi:hypothetical protein
MKAVKKKQAKALDESFDLAKQSVVCICPKCGQRHVVIFRWIGRGIPRKYCPPCKILVKSPYIDAISDDTGSAYPPLAGKNYNY